MIQNNLESIDFLIQESYALLSRLNQVKSFDLTISSVEAAKVSREAYQGIQILLDKGKRELFSKVNHFIQVLKQQQKINTSIRPDEWQSAFSLLKLRFNTLLDELDIFADVLNQRSEHTTGIWLAGLDVFAKDSLTLPKQYYSIPPLVCYLDRGHGAAIRRARTKLPGGHNNPVAVIRLPRERMIGSGIASSLVHEAGHQGSALLGLVSSIRPLLSAKAEQSIIYRIAWSLFGRWIGEIISDFWSVARVGCTSTLGLINLVSLPRYFVMRMLPDKPHPFPWIRVKISAAIGKALFPHPQWLDLEALWEELYPLHPSDHSKNTLIKQLEEVLPEFVSLLINHRPESLQGKKLVDIFPLKDIQPARLSYLFKKWQSGQLDIYQLKPCTAFAMLGQARFHKQINAFAESEWITRLLSHWALKRAENKEPLCFQKKLTRNNKLIEIKNFEYEY
ncbi:MAG: hypothetical protein NW226_26770 [Microscillaceae bacterium]|nr:hypothetical protein [Microscillaceae bacterium]